MRTKRSITAIAFAFVVAGSAQAQSPSIAGAWGDMKLSLQECLSRGSATFERLKFTRIEAVSFTVYADQGNFQIGIRCMADRNLFFVFGGGPGNQEKQLIKSIDDVKNSFLR